MRWTLTSLLFALQSKMVATEKDAYIVIDEDTTMYIWGSGSSTAYIHVEVTIPRDYYLALAFEGLHTNSDMVIFKSYARSREGSD